MTTESKITLEREYAAVAAAELEARRAVHAAQGRAAGPAEMRRVAATYTKALKRMGAVEARLGKLAAEERGGATGRDGAGRG